MAKLRRMIIEPDHNGGYHVSHEHEPMRSKKSPAFMESHEEHYNFGPGQGKQFGEHIYKHLGLKGNQNEENEVRETDRTSS